METEMTCEVCGFSIDFINVSTHRLKIKHLREQYVVSKLFGCIDCVKRIRDKIKELENDE
jgi:hypothetical protein